VLTKSYLGGSWPEFALLIPPLLTLSAAPFSTFILSIICAMSVGGTLAAHKVRTNFICSSVSKLFGSAAIGGVGTRARVSENDGSGVVDSFATPLEMEPGRAGTIRVGATGAASAAIGDDMCANDEGKTFRSLACGLGCTEEEAVGLAESFKCVGGGAAETEIASAGWRGVVAKSCCS